MNNRPIGVFDSGVGGLSVLIELKKLLPNESFIYLGDQKNAPYGGKSKEEIVQLTSNAMDFFIKNDVKMVVLACNTATVYAIEQIRAKYPLPVIGTVPVIKQLKKHTKSGKTAVFSTPATAKSTYLKDLVEKYAPDIDVELIGGSNLEELVENGNLNTPEIKNKLESILKPLVEKGVDVIVLGCTHYPFLRDKIQEVVGENVSVIDSGGAVARRTKEVLELENLEAESKIDDLYFTTGDLDKFTKVSEELLNEKLKNIEKVYV